MELLPKINDPKDLRALPEDKIPQVSQEIRKWILDCVSKIGGHLGSSLGSAEITTSLHYVFDTPRDRLIWDTGHQTYGHKILTGRREELKRIRQFDGISGFLKRSESEYDCFGAGHASTAISAALGMAAARDLKGEKNKVVAIVSDGCITGGESYEGLQNAGQVQSDLIVILNDNQMFISQKVGAMSAFLTRLLTLGRIRNAQKEIEKFLARFKLWGAVVLRVAKRAKVLLFPGMLFEEMGFSYFGPIDGHDTHQLIKVFQHIKEMRGPILVHCVTKKGKGYDLAEKDPLTWHGPGKFDVKTGQMKKSNKPALPTYTKVFAKALVKLAEEDPRITAITAAMPEGTGTDAFRDRFPKRFYDVGLAEQHSVTFGAGQACEGFRPVVAVYSTFLQRAYDQVVHDVAIQSLPVRFAIDRAGYVGADGSTHCGAFDLPYLCTLPGFVVMAPADEAELMHMTATAAAIDDRPSAIRYPRGEGVGVELPAKGTALEIGKGRIVREGSTIAILSLGSRLQDALKAAEDLAARGLSTTVADARFAKPIDEDLVRRLAAGHEVLVTVEEGSIGGFSAQVLQFMANEGLLENGLKVRAVTMPDAFIEQDKPEAQCAQAGLDAAGIVATVLAALGRSGELTEPARA